MFGSFILLLIVLAGLLIIVGVTNLGWRILIFAIALAFVAPIFSKEFLLASSSANEYGGSIELGIAIVILFIVLIAFIRFVNHRRKMESWIGDRPTSKKRRIERD